MIMRSPLPLALAALTGAGSPNAALAAERVILAGRDITVADLAVLDAAERARFGGLVAATIPAGNNHLELDSSARETLLRRRVPGRQWRLISGGTVRFEGKPLHPVTSPAPRCFTLHQDLKAGDYLQTANVSPTPCIARPSSLPLRFDRRVNAPQLAAPLPAGTYLGPVVLSGKPVVDEGTQLSLILRTGPVTIERSVQAVQPSRLGTAVFIRTQDGTILSSRIASAAEGASQ
jgi:hypothetical protein